MATAQMLQVINNWTAPRKYTLPLVRMADGAQPMTSPSAPGALQLLATYAHPTNEQLL